MGLICSSYEGLHTAIPLNNGAIRVKYDTSSSEVIFKDDSRTIILAENVSEAKANDIIDDFLKRLKMVGAPSKEVDSADHKYKTWNVFAICLLVIAISFYLSWPKKEIDISSVLAMPYEGYQSTVAPIGNEPSEPEELVLSAEFADKILKADISEDKRDEISAGMEQINELMFKMSDMSKEQRLAYVQRPDVQELLSKKWAIDLAE